MAGGPPSVVHRRWSVAAGPPLVALAAVLTLWTVALADLGALPVVHEDEAWIAAPALGLVQRGVYGAAMFSGYYGMERHYYEFMPLYPLLLAASFKLFGVGLVQARLVSAMCGALVVALTYAVGARLFGASVGAVAGWLLLTVRLRDLALPQVTTGIPLVDVARVARYDVTVPVFGLAAFFVVLRWPHRWRGWLTAGILVGLAGLAHLYGLFWGPALALLLIMEGAWSQRHVLSGLEHEGRKGTKAQSKKPDLSFAPSRLRGLGADNGRETSDRQIACMVALAAGVALAWTPWLAYAAGSWDDFLGQSRAHADRFDLLSPLFYVTNVVREPLRYLSGVHLGVGAAVAGLGLTATLAALAVRAWRGDSAARVLLVVTAMLAALFAALLSQKQFSYLATVLPLLAVAGAWGVIALWRRGGALRGVMLAVAVVVVAEGAAQWLSIPARAQTVTPYETATARLAEVIPSGARVLGIQLYGLGLRDVDYRSFLVPVYRRDPRLVDAAAPLDASLDEMQPTVILIDPQMARVIDPALGLDARGQAMAGEFWGWMAGRGARLVATVDDATYGPVRVYRIEGQ